MPPTETAPDASTLRPWQFFTLLALFSATAAVFVVRGTSPQNVILICLAIGAAALVGIATLRTLKPLVSVDVVQAEMIGSRTRAALEREKTLVMRSLKELEFDHAMGKVSNSDFEDMTSRLRSRAVRLLKQLDSAESGYRELIERELASRLGRAGPAPIGSLVAESGAQHDEQPTRAGTCTSCRTSNDIDARFCKQCGAKLLLMLLMLFTCAASAWAQFQMPDPKQMSGIPRPVTDLPEGHISVRLIRGQLANNIPDFPVELRSDGKVVATVKTDENGRAEFGDIKGGTQVQAVAVVDGERLESEAFPAPTEGGIRLMLVATPKGGAASSPAQPLQKGAVVLGDQTRVILDMADDVLQVYYLLDFRNTASGPVLPTSTVVLDMPKEAQGTSLLGPGAQAVVRGSRVTIPGPFPPGPTEIQVGYQLPYSGGDAVIAQKLPVPVGNIAVLMKKLDAMSMTSPQLPEVENRDFEGEHYVLAQGPPQAAGSTLTVNITGLPHHSAVPRTIALVLAFFTTLIGIGMATRAPRSGSDSARLKQLKGKRERIFADLVRLEQQRQAGTIEPARYAERRPSLVSQLERVFRDLDTEGGQGLAA